MNATLSLRKNTKKGYSVRLSLSYNNRTMYVNTGISITNSDNFCNNEISKEEKNYKSYNAYLGRILNTVRTFLLSYHLTTSRKDEKLENAIKSIVKGEEPKKTKLFLDYLDEFAALKTKPGTRTVYNDTKKKIISYDKDCTFETMNIKWLTDFEKFCARTMKINAYAIHFRNIRAVFNYALDEELTTLYPFRRFKIKKQETQKRNLSVEQIRTLRDFKVEKYQEQYRDLFMLMFYLIGINAADLFSLTETNIVDGRIVYHRAKTGKLYSIKIEPEAEEIINKYRGEKFLLFPCDTRSTHLIYLHRMNIALSNIGQLERKGYGGKKTRHPLFPELSSYWARHTWATIAASLDIPKETISAALGHEIGSNITSIYIEFDRDKIDKANRQVIDYIKRQS